MSRKGNRIGNSATEQVFGHLKDEFFRDRKWPDFESFKADLNAYVTYWNTQRRQVKLKGLTPEEFRNQSLAPLFFFRPSKFLERSSRTVGSRGFKRQNISLSKVPLCHWFADMPGGASVHTRLPRLALPLR
jgi:hypothetical protein